MTTVNPAGTRTYPDERHTETRTEKGLSLARGPALILGTILLAVGLYLLYKARTFPPFSNFPNGSVTKDGDFLFGLFGANGWTGMLTAVGGGLLLFGAAQHLLAKTMSLIVGVALGAAAVIALASGNVLGMAAANGWTKLGWAVCAVILLFNTLVPRRRRTVVVADEPVGARRGVDEPVATRRGVDEPVATRRGVDEPVADRRGVDEPVADRRGVDEPVADRRGVDEPVGDRRGVDEPVADRGDEVHESPAMAEARRDRVADEQPTVAHNGVARDGEPAEIRRDD